MDIADLTGIGPCFAGERRTPSPRLGEVQTDLLHGSTKYEVTARPPRGALDGADSPNVTRKRSAHPGVGKGLTSRLNVSIVLGKKLNVV